MAIKHSRPTVGTTAVDITSDADTQGHTDIVRSLVIQNTSASAVSLGGPGVTVANAGYVIPAGGEVSLDLTWSDRLYAVAPSSVTVNVLHLGI